MKDLLFHDSHQLFYRNPFGAVLCGHKIILRLKVYSNSKNIDCYLRLWENSTGETLIKMEKTNERHQDPRGIFFEGEIFTPQEPCILWYFFVVRKDGNTYYYGNNSKELGGIGETWSKQPPSYQITVYKESKIPPWFKNGIMYQIFVDRFFNGLEDKKILNPKKKSLIHGDWYDTPLYIKDSENRIKRWDFFGGNLLGIIKKLPYLKELGITIIYLNPIFEAASNHKYDTGNYKKIDPMFGDNETFQELAIKAREYGISIILDGVFSHTGSDSIYFNKYGNYSDLGAYQSDKSPYYNWYHFNKESAGYLCWWGIDDLPNVNELEPSYQDFIFKDKDSVVKYWMKMGARGWRLDVADELPAEFIKELRNAVKETDPNSILIGEVWEDASNKISYGQLRQYLLGEELDSVTNYPFRRILLSYILGSIDGSEAGSELLQLFENYPPQNFYCTMNLIGSHDVPRVLTLLGEAPEEHQLSDGEKEEYRLNEEQRKLGIKRLKLLSLIQMTFPGIPCVYYGDEVGMEGYSDPYNRGPYPWGREDQDILAWYKKIIRLRKQYSVFTDGNWYPLNVEGDLFGFQRENRQETAINIFNRNKEKEITFQLDTITRKKGIFRDILNDKILKENFTITLQPLEGMILLVQNG